MTQTATAKECKTSTDSIARWRKLPAFREALEDEIDGILDNARALALKEIAAELFHDNVYVRQNAARDILTRCGLKLKASESNEVVIRVEGMPALGSPPMDESMPD